MHQASLLTHRKARMDTIWGKTTGASICNYIFYTLRMLQERQDSRTPTLNMQAVTNVNQPRMQFLYTKSQACTLIRRPPTSTTRTMVMLQTPPAACSISALPRTNPILYTSSPLQVFSQPPSHSAARKISSHLAQENTQHAAQAACQT